MPTPWERRQQQARVDEGPWARYQPPAQEPEKPSLLGRIGQQVGRQAGLTGRAMVEGVADLAAPFSDAVGSALNLGLGAAGIDYRFPKLSQHTSETLTDVGLPEPAGTVENIANFGGRLATGIAAGGPATGALLGRLGFPNAPPPKLPPGARTSGPAPTSAQTAAQTLERAGIPLDASQRSGGRLAQLVRAAVTKHPATADAQQAFGQTQQKAFNRAVLRSIGADADEATQGVMLAAKKRIGAVFDRIGQQGAQFDDALQTRIASIVDDAQATVPQSELAPLAKNIDDLLNGVDDAGRINGEIFTRIRSRLSDLARRPGIGQSARELEDALMDALERSHPGQRELLRGASEQWRNMRMIEQAIGKGAERDISPLRLSNALASTRNRAMSVYGQGGDQGLVSLAQAGRTVLPEAIPSSGTAERSLMNMPLRALGTAPFYKAAQIGLLKQPGSGPQVAARQKVMAALLSQEHRAR